MLGDCPWASGIRSKDETLPFLFEGCGTAPLFIIRFCKESERENAALISVFRRSQAAMIKIEKNIWNENVFEYNG